MIIIIENNTMCFGRFK